MPDHRMPDHRAILTYHSLDGSGSILSVEPGVFRRQMRSLGEGGIRVVALDDLVNRELAPDHQPTVALTFDDGFRNFYTEAFPVLAEHGFPATVFLVTGYCGRTNDWPSQAPGLGGRPLLDWRQVAELQQSGVRFGAHTVTHPRLSGLPLAAAAAEMVESKKQIEDRTGSAVSSFAYPYGAESAALREVAGAHFEIGCSTRLGPLRADSPRQSLERIDVYYLGNSFLFRRLFRRTTSRYLAGREWLRKWRSRFSPPQ